MKTRPRDARERFVKASPTLSQSEDIHPVSGDSIAVSSKNDEHDTLHQTLRQVNRMAQGGEEPSVKNSLKNERFMENALRWIFVVFVVWILWLLFVS